SGSFGKAKVGGKWNCRASHTLDFSDHLGKIDRIAGGQYQLASLLRNAQRDCASDATTSTGYDDDLFLKRSSVCSHCVLLIPFGLLNWTTMPAGHGYPFAVTGF